MAITGIGNNHNNVHENTYAAQKKEAAKETGTKDTTPAQAENTKKAGTDSVSDYYSYLQKNYDCMSNGANSIHKQLRTELEDYIKAQYFGKSPLLLSAIEKQLDTEG